MKTKNTKKYWLIGAIVVVALALVFYLSHSMKQNGGSLTPPKKISFVKQAKGSGTHIWFEATIDEKDDSKPITKNSPIYAVIVLKDGRSKTFRITDGSFTLGKAAKMSDKDIISYAEEQNKKFPTDIQEQIAEYGKNHEISSKQRWIALGKELQNSLYSGPDLSFRISGNSYDYLLGKDPVKDTKLGDYGENAGILSKHVIDVSTKDLMYGYVTANSTDGGPSTPEEKKIANYFDKCETDALIYHIKHTKNIANEWSKVRVKNTTDASGNKLVSQKIWIKQFDGFAKTDDDTLSKGIDNLSASKKKQIEDLLAHPAKTKAQRLADIKKVFDQEYFRQVTKDFYTPAYDWWTYTLESGNIISQPIYNARYIGYRDEMVSIVTKAQTKDQKAMLAD